MSKRILIKPVITEKMNNETEKFNRYGFVVALDANKIEIKKAVEVTYGVNVTAVRTMRQGGGKAKTKYTNKGLMTARTPLFKKAIVELAAGEMIDLYGNE